jgi:Fe-S cluster biogenesis protein NfuA
MSESDLPIDPAITIQAETSLVDPDTCKFTVSRTVHPGGPFFFDDRKRARGSPLVERLFALPGVAYVLIAGNVVTVGKEPGASWSGLRPAIGTGLRTQLLTGIPAILEAAANAGTRERTDAESRAVVQQLLDREINRSIAAHGGQISIVDVRDGNLFIAMSGGCQGCSRISSTRRTTQRGIRRSTAAQGRAGIHQDGRASGYVNPCGGARSLPGLGAAAMRLWGVPEAGLWL